MKVLHFITSLKIGGAETALVTMLERMRDAQFEHHVLYLYPGPNVGRIKNLGIPTYQVSGLFSSYDPIAIIRLHKLIKKIKPDIIHAALWSANVLAKPCAWWHKIPLICDLHGDCRYYGTIRNLIEKVTMFFPARYVAVSNSAHDSFVKKFNVSNSRISLVQNGIDIDGIQKQAHMNPLSRTEIGFSDNDFVIGTVGRFDPIKRYDLLLRAFAQISDVRAKLCFVGDGKTRKILEKLTHDLKIEKRVHFVGERIDAYSFYPLFDCFVLSSQSEGLSIALLEAMCFGLPIVTMHASDKHDVITHGKHGFLVPVGNVSALAGALETLFHNEKLRDTMKQANQELVRSHFNLDSVVRKYSTLYKDVLL